MKNKSTNLFRYFYANTSQNTGGGTSQFLRSESVRSTLAGRRLSNTLITHESPTNHPLKQSVWKVAAMILMVLTLGIGNAWGTNPADTVTVHSPGKITGANLVSAYGRNYEVFFSDNASLTQLLVGSNTSTTTQATGENKWCCVGASCGNTSNSISTAFTIGEFTCNVKTSNHKALRVQSTAQIAKVITMVVSGYDSIATLDKDEVQLYAEIWDATKEQYGTQSKLTAAKTKSASSHNKRAYVLDASKRYRLTIAYGTSGSTNKTLYGFSLCIPVAPSCQEPAAPTISSVGDKTSFTEGETITLTASHDGSNHSATTTYQWFKGATFATASSVQAAATGSSGYTFTKTAATSDEGTYWCEAANSTCKSHNTTGFAIEVSAAPAANPVITGAVNEAGWGSVTDAITVTSGSTISISSNVLTCDEKTLTATATAATAEYTYAFVNWTGVANGDEVTTNVTATATFSRTANNYSLAWDKNAEDADALAGDYTSGTVAYGSEITKPNTPTRDGYDFLGWAESASGDVVEVPTTMPAANKTYYAKWAADPCSEPAEVTNEIARFFVPCGLANYKNSTAWVVSDEEASTNANTFNTYKFGGGSSNWYRNTTTGFIYGKLAGDDAYIQIKLKNDKPFKAGDVVYVYCNRNNASKSSVKLHDQSTGNEVTLSSTAAGVEASGSYTLVAADVESDGSLKFFRSSSNTFVNRIIVTREPACVGDPGDISKGTLSAGVLTLNAAGSPLSGDTWYWQSSSTGTDQTNSGTSYGVSAAGTYYVRSYNATGTCWSDAKSITVTAEDLVESFTVVFKDGETTLGSETVEVGKHPSAAGISTTKEFYTFAAWQESGVDKALNTVSAANGETVTLTARYTGNYAYGTYLFNSLTMGSTISKTITDKEVVYNDAFRVDNFYFAAGIKIQGEIGTAEETTTLTNYKGWKLKTNAKTIKFLVENNSQVKVAIGEKTGIQVTYTPLVGAETTASQAKDNETAYSVKGGTVVTITTTSDNTTTLKRLSISNLYNVTYTDGTGDASGSASSVPEVTLPTPTETTVTVESTDYSFTGWKANQAVTVNDVVKSAGTLLNAGDVAVLGANTTFTAQWAVVTPKYAITKGTHTNGDFTISVAEQEAGGAVTLTATPNEDYVFSAWAVVKTEDGSATGITVSNNTFTMPAYGVTVNATFAADPRSKVLYVTSNTADATKSDDKVYAALKDTYNVKIVGPTSDADQSGYALVVLHESLNGGNDYNKTAVAAAKTGTTPVLNTKAYFYSSGRWAWGTPNAGKKTKGVHVNRTYCNITNHPLFNDLTPDANDSIIILSSISGDNKPIQPIGSFTSGKEGYTLANVPDGCAIHELTPAQRGAVSGKYLLISLYTKDFANLNANGQKLFQNAAAYLIGNTAWEPVNALSSPAVTASPSAAYSVGDNIALTASATGSSAATTYTWYKGDTWAAAEEAGAIQAAATAAAGGNTYGITGCALGDAGTYWCVISNGTGCEVSASLAITVSDIAYDITFVSAHGTAPTATTGVSYTIPELSASGWEHQGWTASIDVTVDAATITAGTKIANGKIATFGADVTFTAVWAEVFDVTFNMQSHGASIAAQHIVDGGKATEPNDPSAIGWDFGGWFTDAECTVGNEFDFNTDISEDTELFAKWTAFTGCTELWPATSGDAPSAVGDVINMQSGSTGATMTALDKVSNLTYTTSGLQFGSTSGVKVKVVLNNDMTVGTKISMTLVAGGTGTRGLSLYTKTSSKINAFTCWVSGTNPASNGAEETFTYTVVAEDGLDGTNEFQLERNNTVCLKSLKVESCGAAVIYHDLTSAITPGHDPAYATVTLSATSVREGRTATATYSEIAEGMEFETWQISGTGASIADASANPAVITMGTADAVITLKVRTETPKHTVSYDMQGHGVAPADEEVKEGKKVTEPEVAEVEGWIFGGWYKEAGCTNAWNFSSDVMGTSDMTLYAKWTADTSIRLIVSGAINSTNYITGATMADGTVSIEDVDYSYATLGNTASSPSVNALNKVITYNATTTRTKIMVDVYNKNTSNRTVKIWGVVEGSSEYEELASITLNNSDNKHVKSAYYEFNNDANRTIYIGVPSSVSDVAFIQVKVVESGEALPMFGQIGYSINFNKGRLVGPSSTDLIFEGMNYNLSSNYQALSGSNISLTKNKSYQFTVPVPTQITIDASKAQYYVTTTVDGEENSTNQDGAHSFNLTAGTWYLRIGSSNMSVKSISFTYPKIVVDGEMDDDDIYPQADVVIPNGAKLTLNDAHTIHSLTINSEAGASGQLEGTNVNVTGDIYLDVKLLDGDGQMSVEESQQWYCISAPFDVAFNGGFFWADGSQMVYNDDFQAFVFDGAKRASTGVSGWQRVSGKMEAGKVYLIGFDDDTEHYKNTKTIRLKAMSKNIPTADKLPATGHTAAEAGQANWNGVGNPTLHYIALDGFTAKVQCYNNGAGYSPYDPTTHNYVVGTALFMQATANIDLKAATNANFRAPKRVNEENEKYSFCVEIAKEDAKRCDNRLYISTSDEATSSYEQGKDMLTMNGTSSKFGALIWTENYGMRLASEDVPTVNDKASYTLGMYAPKAGEYIISTVEASENADLYLTKDGMIIWNLSMNECTMDLNKGNNEGFGLLLIKKAPAVATGIEQSEFSNQNSDVQKVIIDEKVFILRGGMMYDVTGKIVK